VRRQVASKNGTSAVATTAGSATWPWPSKVTRVALGDGGGNRVGSGSEGQDPLCRARLAGSGADRDESWLGDPPESIDGRLAGSEAGGVIA